MRNIVLLTVIGLLLTAWANGDTYETWDLPGSGWGSEVMGMAMVSDTDGWALQYDGRIYHWNGEEWSYVKMLTGGQYFGMEYYDPSHIYAYSPGDLDVYDGTDWSAFEPMPPSGVFDLEVISPNEMWAAGGYVSDPKAYEMVHFWDGVEWTTYMPEGFESHNMSCIGFGSADEGWAGGTVGTMSHFYDGEWHAVDPPLTGEWLTCSSFANPDYGMMGGEGVLMIYHADEWEVREAPHFYVNDIYAISDEYIALVNQEGVIFIFYFDDSEEVKSTGVTLYSVHATSVYDIWCGGEDGFVCHWNWEVGIQPTSVGRIKALFGGEWVSSGEGEVPSRPLR